ncbi:NUDIX hydrolase [Paenibacillus selenitireducens]|uniref:NUDIX hydrolase n=1 Tax=Paenibacillus selenitireducens TaxID=1324314 RepID=A0A1T2X1P3_9BACL|nr:NUDIX domain-containing protein [Paenibacillus selenitireducens]OPA73789.1 NUDIX hydrolase [Paenibacillus selenitireducens]
MYHIRVRPTALVIQDNRVLCIEYKDEAGVHYNLPGGGAEPGETLEDGVVREMLEETGAAVVVGPIAMVYEYAPHQQSGDYDTDTHILNIIFDCTLKENAVPKLPDKPDPYQSEVRWISVSELDDVILYPNIKNQIKEYIRTRKNIELIRDDMLESYSKVK